VCGGLTSPRRKKTSLLQNARFEVLKAVNIQTDVCLLEASCTSGTLLTYCNTKGLGIFLFTTAFRPALGPTQPPIQWVPEALSLGAKQSEREADHSPPSIVEVNIAWSYTSTPPIRLHGVVLS